MKILFLLIITLLLNNCTKPKTVFICGDHVCVNKSEAKQYFEENLTIEVKILNEKASKEINLVELNLNENFNKKKEINVFSKEKTNKSLKVLSNDEIIKIKEKIKRKNKDKQKDKKVAKKVIDKKDKARKKKITEKKVKLKKNKSFNDEINKDNVNKNNNDTVDICTILKKCSIDEISKYLLEKGNKKAFPDITIRQ